MKLIKIGLIILVSFNCLSSYSQTTTSPEVKETNVDNAVISKITQMQKSTEVLVTFKRRKGEKVFNFGLSYDMYIEDTETGIKYEIIGSNDHEVNTFYPIKWKKLGKDEYNVSFLFKKLPSEVKHINVIEKDGWFWKGLKLN